MARLSGSILNAALCSNFAVRSSPRMPVFCPTANLTMCLASALWRARRLPSPARTKERPACSCRNVRQSVFGRLAGYEDVNDAERLRHDPAMRWIVGGKAALNAAASPSQMGRFKTKWLAAE